MALERKRFDLTKDLQKNDRFSLTKDGDEGYNKIQVDLSWDTTGIKSKHGLKGLDLDACAFLVGEDGVITDDADFVYYKSESRWMPEDSRWKDPEQRDDVDVTEGDFAPFDRKVFKTGKKWREETLPVSKDASVFGSWDDLGEDDDEDGGEAGETMHVVLDKVRDDIAEIIFCVSIYPNPEYGPVEKQTYEKVLNAKIEITDEETGNILCQYNLSEKFSGLTAVEVGKLSIDNKGMWEFVALGEGHDGGMQTLIDIYA